jgi:hypothetical protein
MWGFMARDSYKYVYHYAVDDEAHAKLDQILVQQDLILAMLRADVRRDRADKQRDEAVMADLSQLQREVEETGSVVDSAVTLINGLADALREAATDPAEIQRLADQLSGKVDELAAAVDNQPHPDQGLPTG